MAHKNTLGKNLGLQTAYQIINTCLPLITAPYLARTLGATQQGIYSYTSSIVNYFVLFAVMGVSGYGTRSIAAAGNDLGKRSKAFWSIYSMQFITSVIMLGFYTVYLFAFCKENVLIAQIQIISLVSCVFGISWLFFGLEKFRITVTRSFIVRFLTVACILIFIKGEKDLWKYTLIMVSGTLLSDIIFWIYVPKVIRFYMPSYKEVGSHFKPNFLLFLPILAMSVYHLMDKTMLGKLSTYEQSGFYYNADKIINIPIGVISGISTVMLPRMSSLIGEGKKDDSDNLFRISLEGTIIAGTAIAFGIAGIAKEFVPVFFGPGFEECIMLTVVLSPVLLIKSYAFTARYQYLVPHKKEKEYTVSVVAGAVVNLIMNFLLIPKFGAMGAVIGTLLAELAACIWQFIVILSMISIKKTILNCMAYTVIGVIMAAMVRLVAHFDLNVYLKIILEIITGIIVYGVCCIVLWRMTNSLFRDLLLNRALLLWKRKKEN